MNNLYLITDEMDLVNAEINRYVCRQPSYRADQLSWTFPNARPAQQNPYKARRD